MPFAIRMSPNVAKCRNPPERRHLPQLGPTGADRRQAQKKSPLIRKISQARNRQPRNLQKFQILRRHIDPRLPHPLNLIHPFSPGYRSFFHAPMPTSPGPMPPPMPRPTGPQAQALCPYAHKPMPPPCPYAPHAHMPMPRYRRPQPTPTHTQESSSHDLPSHHRCHTHTL